MKRFNMAFKMLLILIGSIIFATTVMIGVYALPVEPMIDNLKESKHVFNEEAIYKEVFNWCTSTLDNYTEAMILQNATYDGQEGLVDKALLNYRYTAVNPYMALRANLCGVKKDVESYGRYWHGYLVYVKPLLLVFNYELIRMINTIGIIGISMYLIYTMYKYGLKKYIVPFCTTYLLMSPMVSFYLLDYSNLIYIFIIASIITIKKKDKWKDNNYIYMFFIVGIVVAFTDFLTYPIITVGIPMIFYFVLDKIDSIKEIISKIIKFSLAWIVGYMGMWGGKWIVASIFTKENIILDALSQVGMRTSSTSEITGEKVTVYGVYSRVFTNYFKNPIAIVLLLVIIACIAIIIKNKLWKNSLKESIPYLINTFGIKTFNDLLESIIAFGHTFDHHLFTYKGLMVFGFSITSILIKMLDKNEKMEEIGNKVKNI